MSDCKTPNYKDAKSIYEFSTSDPNGNSINLKNFKGKICLIINICSKDKSSEKFLKFLSKINGQFKGKGLQIISFPCFQFGAKENISDLYDFLKRNNLNIGDICEPIEVNGHKSPELYKYLKYRQPGNLGGFISKNFQMFLVDRQGQPIERFNPTVDLDYLEEKIYQVIH